jgi:dynein heavy chain, axonemal
MVTDVCDEYFGKMRRQVYQTPKSYLSFIQLYKRMYSSKLNELKVKEGRLMLGLNKLIQVRTTAATAFSISSCRLLQ